MTDNNRVSDPEAQAAIRELEVQAVNFATRFIKDAAVRAEYMRKTKEMAEELTQAYKSGAISAKQAAEPDRLVSPSSTMLGCEIILFLYLMTVGLRPTKRLVFDFSKPCNGHQTALKTFYV
ncbi:MAG: hypothetical protein OEZ43_17850 [Gammaproteobacteria bacterium]|nr:hypothetical protein [Gammaproteobacteria bacterium]